MSPLLGVLLVFAIPISIVGAVFCGCLLKTAITEHRRERQRHDVGPDALRLLQELDTHLDEYVAADPELSAGFDRLRNALREHRKEEGT